VSASALEGGAPVTFFFSSSINASGGADRTCRVDPAKAKTEFERVVGAAGTNSLALLSELPDVDSPLAAVRLHPGILEVTSFFADGCDAPGIERAAPEMLLSNCDLSGSSGLLCFSMIALSRSAAPLLSSSFRATT